MLKISELRHKDLVNTVDGSRMGYIRDIELDLTTGKISALILPAQASALSRFFGRGDEQAVPFEQIDKIGLDVILATCPSFAAVGAKKRRSEQEEEAASLGATSLISKGPAAPPDLSAPEWGWSADGRWRGFPDGK